MNFPIQEITTRRDEGRRATAVSVTYLIDDDVISPPAVFGRPIYSMIDLVFQEIIPNLDAEELARVIAACAARRMEGGV